MPEDENPTPAEDTGDDLARLREALDKERSIRKEAEKTAKTHADAAKRLAELEESQKTEQQKLAEALEAERRRAAELEVRSLKLEVAAEKGVPASSLTGSTREEMVAAAEALLEWRDSAKKKAPPVGGLKSGASPAGDQLTGKERAAAALRQMRAGR